MTTHDIKTQQILLSYYIPRLDKHNPTNLLVCYFNLRPLLLPISVHVFGAPLGCEKFIFPKNYPVGAPSS